MTRLIERHGLEGVIDLLAREYQRLDHARTRLINGLKTAMASHGYALDDCVLDRTWWFGTTHRQFPFNPRRPLTLKLRNHTPEHVLAEWLAAQRPFELPSEQELTRLCDGPPQEPARRTLPLHSPDQGPLLPTFDALDLNELDRKAAELIGLMKRQAESRDRGRTFFGADPLAWWSSPLWYRRGQEQWTDEHWWMNLAKRAWDEEQHQHAALVLMLNGDDRPRAKLLEWYRQMEGYCDEACDDGVVWLLRNQIPWPLDGYGEFPRYPPVLGSPPPETARPVALRIHHEIQTVERGDDPDLAPDEHLDQALAEAASLDAVSGAEWLEPDEIELLHERCRRWAARTDDFFSLREEKPLDAAARFGWTDVVDVLDRNPMYGPAVLEWGFGRMGIGTFAQRLSLIVPGTLAARFAAYVINLDAEAEARALAEEMTRIPGNAGHVDVFRAAYARRYRVEQFAGAIAWLRCRS